MMRRQTPWQTPHRSPAKEGDSHAMATEEADHDWRPSRAGRSQCPLPQSAASSGTARRRPVQPPRWLCRELVPVFCSIATHVPGTPRPSAAESDHDYRQRSDHDYRCSISPWECRSVPHLRMGNGTIFSDPQQRRCQPADVRPIWPARSSDSSTSPNRSFLTASESRSVVRVSARPRASSASTRSVRLSSFSS